MRSKRRKELACPERGGGCEQSEQPEGLKKKVASHGIVNPSVNPPYGVLPAPRPGSLLGVPYKLRHKTNTGTASRPHSLTNSRVHPPPCGFHMAEPYFTARKRNFTLRKQDFTAGGSPLTPAGPLPGGPYPQRLCRISRPKRRSIPAPSTVHWYGNGSLSAFRRPRQAGSRP